MLKPPCKRNCPNRQAGCHSRCEEYREYAAIVGEARDRRNRYKEQEAIYYGNRKRR